MHPKGCDTMKNCLINCIIKMLQETDDIELLYTIRTLLIASRRDRNQ